MPKHIILGSPGTGKTYSLIKIIEKLINKGYSADEICFCTFSRSASNEAKERAVKKFNLQKEDLKYFGTIHSLCNRKFSLDKDVVNISHLKDFFSTTKLDYTPINLKEEFVTGESFYDDDGNILMDFYGKLRINFCKRIYSIDRKDLKKLFLKLPLMDDYYHKIFSNSFNPYDILVKYERYKEENNLVDFIDMLLLAFESDYVIPTKILIVDEFQDLSPLQYEIYNKWSKDKEEIFIAGDPKQTIYSFLCASAEFFHNELKKLKFKEGDEKIVLDKTYRMFSEINKYCQNYIKNLKNKEEEIPIKYFKEGGEVLEDYIYEDLERVLEHIRKDKYTFILFRTNYYKNKFIEQVLIPNGIIYDEVKGQGVWNNRTINLFNAVYKLVNKKPLNYYEVDYLIQNIPFKLGLLKRGLKTHFKDMDRKEQYNISDLLELGFDMVLFKMLSYKKMFSILDITDKIKETFLAAEKKIISFPILIKVGTIHSAKGKEANDVIIFKDVSNRISKNLGFNGKEKNWDEEIRVFYVGLSRAKERLVILRGGFKYADSGVIP